MGSQYLKAYLLLKNVDYSASQEGKLTLENFNQTSYLERIASELEPIEKQIKALQVKNNQINQVFDTLTNNSIQITLQALAEKDRTIQELQQKLAHKEVAHE